MEVEKVMLRIVFLFITGILLGGCTGDNCIEADDFGHSNFTISSRYTKEQLDNQVGENQVAPWVDWLSS